MRANDTVHAIHAGSRQHLRPGRHGCVMGMYQHACHVRLDEQWLALVDGTAGPAPATLLLRAGFPFAAAGWAPGTTVSILPGPVLLVGGYRLDARGAAPWQPPPAPSPLPPAALAANLDRLARQLLVTAPGHAETPGPAGTGPAGSKAAPAQAGPLAAPARSTLLAVTLGLLGYAVPPPSGATAGQRWRGLCQERVSRLAAALHAAGHGGLGVAVQQLAGLGPGLTPSGDDLLAGLSLTLVRAGAGAPAAALAGALATVTTATTPVAREMIRWALTGEAAAHLLALVDAAIADPNGVQADTVAAALSHGASSGADWTAGVLLALAWLAVDRAAVP